MSKEVKAEIVEWTGEQIHTIRTVLAPDLNNDEFDLFAQVCRAKGLDPFQNQIHAVKRKGRVVFQTGIDGYRVIAARTKQHVGTSDYQFNDSGSGRPKWARVTVKRLVGGHIAEFTATARWEEYAATGKQAFMWEKMPRQMLGKCAEAQALRKAFPADMSGMYTDEEMQQADNARGTATVIDARPPVPGPMPVGCPDCGGPMDNFYGMQWPNKKGPDFRCQTRECGGTIFEYDVWLNDVNRPGVIDVPSTQSETVNPNLKQIEAPTEEPKEEAPDPDDTKWTGEKLQQEGDF